MITIHGILKRDQARLAEALGQHHGDARLEAQLLMARALGVNRAWLLAHGEEAPSPEAAACYSGWLARRLTGEPIAYIFGEKEFYGLLFKVSPAVLIPRPETELLVELALARIPENAPCRVLDLGTGSGAVAITLARLRPHAEVMAVDVSAAALALAQENARMLEVTQVRFIESDWFSALDHVGKFDVIVGNPPYIAAGDPHLSQGDLRFEPPHALASGASGRLALTRIISQSARHLSRNGTLLLEHGYDQGMFARATFSSAGYSDVTTHADLAGVDRVTVGTVD